MGNKLVLILYSSIFLFFLSSCSDDAPVQPPQIEFDSARFNWRDVQIPSHGFTAMWAADTNKVFLLNFFQNSLYIESAGQVNTYSVGSNLYLNDLKGISENEVYVFGTDLASGKMIIIKWNGAGFEYYTTSITVTGGHALSVIGCAVNSNEVWVCCQDGISKFDGSSFTNYSYEEPQLYSQRLFLARNNKLEYIAAGDIDTSTTRITLYEFRDTAFVRVFEYTDPFYPSQSHIAFYEAGGEKFGIRINRPDGMPFSLCMLDFTGSGFTNRFCFNKKIQTVWSTVSFAVAGAGQQDFIILIQSESSLFDSRVGVIHWNGNRPSRELRVLPYTSIQNHDDFITFAINTNSYLVLEPLEQSYNCKLHFGTKK